MGLHDSGARTVARNLLVAGVAAMVGCSRPVPSYAPDMWEGVAYDRPLTVEQLAQLGWRCHRWDKPDADGLDGQCGPDDEPGFDVFGVPAAASSVFLKNGSSAVVNVQLHATAAPFVAENLFRVFGSPEKSMNDNGTCVLLWDRTDRAYELYLNDDDPAKYVTLFVASRAGTFGPLQATSPWGALKATLSRRPCARY